MTTLTLKFGFASDFTAVCFLRCIQSTPGAAAIYSQKYMIRQQFMDMYKLICCKDIEGTSVDEHMRIFCKRQGFQKEDHVTAEVCWR